MSFYFYRTSNIVKLNIIKTSKKRYKTNLYIIIKIIQSNKKSYNIDYIIPSTKIEGASSYSSFALAYIRPTRREKPTTRKSKNSSY